MLAKLDQRLIDFATMVCWWVEVRFNKDSFFLANKSRSLELLLGVFFWWTVIQENPTSNHIWLLYTFLSFDFVMFFLATLFHKRHTDILRKIYPRGFPSPCRWIQEHCKKRWTAVIVNSCLVVLVSVFVLVGSVGVVTVVLFYALCVLNPIYYYLVASDSIPPEEKARRKQAVETFSNNLSPNPV